MPDDLPRIPNKRGPRNRPRDDAWLQQQLAAYRPLYTFRCALPVTAALSFACIALSVALYKSTLSAFQLKLEYTDCVAAADAATVKLSLGPPLTCSLAFQLSAAVTGDVRFFYALHGFYQNTRKYTQSRSDKQLAGDVYNVDECVPYMTRNVTGRHLPVVPCGAIADSFFNDTFALYYEGAAGAEANATPAAAEAERVPWTTRDLLHPSFRQEKYRNPLPCGEERECHGFANTAPPRWWRAPLARLGDADAGRALENFDFIQWMETAALPNFRKLYRRLAVTPNGTFANGLPSGRYRLEVEYNFWVDSYGGRKFFVVQRKGALGPRTHFQTFAYFGVGALLTAFTLFMLIVEFAPLFTARVRAAFRSRLDDRSRL